MKAAPVLIGTLESRFPVAPRPYLPRLPSSLERCRPNIPILEQAKAEYARLQ